MTSRQSSASRRRPQRGPGTTKRLSHSTARCPGIAIDWPTCDGSRKATTPDGAGSAYGECVPGVPVNGMAGAIT